MTVRTPTLSALLGDPRAKPDVRWVERLTGATPTKIQRTFAELEGERELVEELRTAYRAGGREFYAQIRAPFELYALVRLLRPAHVVETGVSSGLSSTFFLLGLEKNRTGVLHSIDLPTHQKGPVRTDKDSPVSLPPGLSTGWAVPASFRDGWDLRIGPSQKLLPQLANSRWPIDLFLHDDLHTPAHLTFELETIRPRLSPGAVVLADNTVWTGGAFDRFAAALGVPVVRKGRTDLVGARVPPKPPAPTRAGRAPAAGRRTAPPRRSR
ncbi:MAG: class I SAM-dependent methyltransferase [Thermoplasmata archaeon]|nr:class I SAM-dependent methyltransferase [Thermoplasmata archaeon]